MNRFHVTFLGKICIAWLIVLVPFFSFASLISTDSVNLVVTIGSTSTEQNNNGNNSGNTGGSSGGGGGSIGSTPSINPVTSVVFRGIAYPGSDVTLVRDGQFVAKVPAGPDARFEITLSNVTEGSYTYGVWAEDSQGLKSITRAFTESITSGVTTVISGIFLPPTISIDKTEVKRGDPITVLGQSAPNASVNVVFHSADELQKNTTADNNGVWSYMLNSFELENGNHSTAALATEGSDITPLSQYVNFIVGDQNVLNTNKTSCVQADLNCDGNVDLIDFSILAYWYKRPLTDDARARVDLNHDGVVNLIDFSILAYYWNG